MLSFLMIRRQQLCHRQCLCNSQKLHISFGTTAKSNNSKLNNSGCRFSLLFLLLLFITILFIIVIRIGRKHDRYQRQLTALLAHTHTLTHCYWPVRAKQQKDDEKKQQRSKENNIKKKKHEEKHTRSRKVRSSFGIDHLFFFSCLIQLIIMFCGRWSNGCHRCRPPIVESNYEYVLYKKKTDISCLCLVEVKILRMSWSNRQQGKRNKKPTTLTTIIDYSPL